MNHMKIDTNKLFLVFKKFTFTISIIQIKLESVSCTIDLLKQTFCIRIMYVFEL